MALRVPAGALNLGPRGLKGPSWGPGSGPQGPQLGPFPQKKKSCGTYIDFHDKNNKRIRIDDTRVLWEWEEEEEEGGEE